MKVIEFNTISRRVRTPDFRQVCPNFFNFLRGIRVMTELQRLLMKRRCQGSTDFAKVDELVRVLQTYNAYFYLVKTRI